MFDGQLTNLVRRCLFLLASMRFLKPSKLYLLRYPLAVLAKLCALRMSSGMLSLKSFLPAPSYARSLVPCRPLLPRRPRRAALWVLVV